jgi:membrane protein required for beta-lactamase induction
MAIDVETGSEASMTHLVSGIIADAQDLIKQQLALLRHELAEDLRKTKEASFLLAWGLGIALVGSVLLCLMLVQLLSWEVPELPLWICYGVVGTPIAALGSALFFTAIHKFRSFNPLPSQSVQALKENVQWITSPK